VGRDLERTDDRAVEPRRPREQGPRWPPQGGQREGPRLQALDPQVGRRTRVRTGGERTKDGLRADTERLWHGKLERAIRIHDRNPARVDDSRQRTERRAKELRTTAGAQQTLGEVDQLADGACLSRGPVALPPEAHIEQNGDRPDDHVDPERKPVDPPSDRERPIRRDEEDVVGEEPDGNGNDPADDPAERDGRNHRNHEHQRDRSLRHLRPHREEHRNPERDQDDGDRRADDGRPAGAGGSRMDHRRRILPMAAERDDGQLAEDASADELARAEATASAARAAGVDVEPTGRFRIYLGAMPGVGKTCAMLDEGYRRYHRGTDVVVGFVETHGRDHTAALIRDLPVLPRRTDTYRGHPASEFDLDAALARHPQVILVDELAHTNIEGLSRHAKRYEDILELLDNGISVITTVNIQHLESVAPLVEELLGIPVRERVPDAIVRSADQIELVDSSPQALRRRMLHGHVYPPERVAWALEHYFTTRNLTVLRELALRFVADTRKQSPATLIGTRSRWRRILETKERYLAGLSLSPESPRILRRAARMAVRSHADLYALLVHPDESDASRNAAQVAELRRLAEDLGAIFLERQGTNIAEALVAEARDRDVTQIVVGASRRSRMQELLHGSVLNRLLCLAGPLGIDVHVIGERAYDPGPDDDL